MGEQEPGLRLTLPMAESDGAGAALAMAAPTNPMPDPGVMGSMEEWLRKREDGSPPPEPPVPPSITAPPPSRLEMGS